jgi:hypothetical protein
MATAPHRTSSATIRSGLMTSRQVRQNIVSLVGLHRPPGAEPVG